MLLSRRLLPAILAACCLALGAEAVAEPLAKDLFGAHQQPAAISPAAHGFYSRGCLAGGAAIAVDGPHWQAMRLSRNRRWGHPNMISLIERLAREAAGDGWPGLLVGDISQPRGGPMLSGHASHQIGLDADIWFTPMPNRRLTHQERETISATSMIAEGSLKVDERRWTPAHAAVLRRAASYPQVERILVHPGIKQKLCESVTGDRSWLRKVRPFWGHDYHFHIRMACPPGSPGCRAQDPAPRGEGCDASLAWWFTEEPWRPAQGPQEPRARDVMTMSALPKACQAVLAAPAPGAAGAASAARTAAAEFALPLRAPVPTARPAR